MSKAAAELPETMDPGESTEKVNVDDLLAQMAGDEIDRLLAEADDPREVPASPSPAATVTAPPPPVAAPQTKVSNPDAAPTDEDVAGLVDDLLAGLSDDAPSPIESAVSPTPVLETAGQAAAIATPPVEAHSLQEHAPAETKPSPTAADDGETSSLEKSALEDPVFGADHAAVAEHESDFEDRPLPFYLKPLAWINAPLDSLSDPVRELIGKLALLTLFNASAVLMYVLIFRRHHH